MDFQAFAHFIYLIKILAHITPNSSVLQFVSSIPGALTSSVTEEFFMQGIIQTRCNSLVHHLGLHLLFGFH